MTGPFTHLCVGGPLDGQYRSLPEGCFYFRVAKIPKLGILMAKDAHRAVSAPPVKSIEYILVWSSEHGRFVWWCNQ